MDLTTKVGSITFFICLHRYKFHSRHTLHLPRRKWTWDAPRSKPLGSIQSHVKTRLTSRTQTTKRSRSLISESVVRRKSQGFHRDWRRRRNMAFWATRVLEIVKKHDSGGLLWKRIKLTPTRKANAKKRLRRVWQVRSSHFYLNSSFEGFGFTDSVFSSIQFRIGLIVRFFLTFLLKLGLGWVHQIFECLI